MATKFTISKSDYVRVRNGKIEHVHNKVVKHYTEDELIAMDIEELDTLAFGVTSGQIVSLKPSDINIYLSDIENPEYKYKKEGMSWVNSVSFDEPVEVSIKQDGKLYLEDGHHRWFAANKLGKNLKAEITVQANPVKYILEHQMINKANYYRVRNGKLEYVHDSRIKKESFYQSLTKVSGPLGSNPGGIYEDKAGQRYYIKVPSDKNRAVNEVIAAKLYELAGVAVPKIDFINANGQLGVISKWVNGIERTLATPEHKGTYEGFVTDAWLANWDTVGDGYDNLLSTSDRKAIRVDVGGALLYRARGEAKGNKFGSSVTEIDTLRDPSVNAPAASVFSSIKPSDLLVSAAKVTQITDGDIAHIVNTYGSMWDINTREKLISTLIDRREYIADRFSLRKANYYRVRNGKLELVHDNRVKHEVFHYSHKNDLVRLDPSAHGSGFAGAEVKRKKADPENWVDRTYFYVGELHNKEADLGPHKYGSEFDPTEIYDFAKDPDNLKALSTDYGVFSVTKYEKQIKDAGYKGFIVHHPQLGSVIAAFYPQEVERLTKSGYIAVDLDKTLAKYSDGDDIRQIGKPIKPMLDRIKAGIAEGKKFKIFTARAASYEQIPLVELWLKENGLDGLEVTNKKTPDIVEIWDDRARQVEPNTGKFTIRKSDYTRIRLGKLERVHDKRTKKPVVTVSHKQGGAVSPRADFEGDLTFVAVLAENPKLVAKNAESVTGYTGFKTVKGEQPAKTISRLIGQLTDNLEWLVKQIPPDKINSTKKWYEGANKIAGEWGDKYNITKEQAAGVIATMSPQLDWFQNLHLAQHVIETYNNKQNEPWNKAMAQYVDSRVLSEIEGKTFAEVEGNEYKAIWLLAYNKAQGKSPVSVYTPEGERTTDTKGETSWFTSAATIAKALNILDGASISPNLSKAHKVRNFYNNIIDPSDPDSVTIDTHAVAAAYLSPMGSYAPEVLHNFGSADVTRGINKPGTGKGVQGTYYVVADAYRKAAGRLGLLPRELQSVVWEYIREVFPKEFKKRNESKEIFNVWNEYTKGRKTIDEARSEVAKLWRSDHKLDGGPKNPSDKGKLRKSVLWAKCHPGGLGARTACGDSRRLVILSANKPTSNLRVVKSMGTVASTPDPKPSLIPMVKIVHKKGKTFPQKYWVDPNKDSKSVLQSVKKESIKHEQAKEVDAPTINLWNKIQQLVETFTVSSFGEAKMEVSAEPWGAVDNGNVINFTFGYDKKYSKLLAVTLPKNGENEAKIRNPMRILDSDEIILNKAMFAEALSWLYRQGIKRVVLETPSLQTLDDVSVFQHYTKFNNFITQEFKAKKVSDSFVIETEPFAKNDTYESYTNYRDIQTLYSQLESKAQEVSKLKSILNTNVKFTEEQSSRLDLLKNQLDVSISNLYDNNKDALYALYSMSYWDASNYSGIRRYLIDYFLELNDSKTSNVIKSISELSVSQKSGSLMVTDDVVKSSTVISQLTESWKSSSRSVGAQLLQQYVSEFTNTKRPSYFTQQCNRVQFDDTVEWLQGTKLESVIKDYIKSVYDTTQEEITGLSDTKAKAEAQIKQAKADYDIAMVKFRSKIGFLKSSLLESIAESGLDENSYLFRHVTDVSKIDSYSSADIVFDSIIELKVNKVTDVAMSVLAGQIEDIKDTWAVWGKLTAKYADMPQGVDGSDDSITLYRGVSDAYTASSTLESWTTERHVAEEFDGGAVIQKNIPKSAIYCWWGSKNWRHKEVGSLYDTEKEFVVIADRIPPDENKKETKFSIKAAFDIALQVINAKSMFFHEGSSYEEDSKVMLDLVQRAGGVDAYRLKKVLRYTEDSGLEHSISFEGAEVLVDALIGYWGKSAIESMLVENAYDINEVAKHVELAETLIHDNTKMVDIDIEDYDIEDIQSLIHYVGKKDINVNSLSEKLTLSAKQAHMLYKILADNWDIIWS